MKFWLGVVVLALVVLLGFYLAAPPKADPAHELGTGEKESTQPSKADLETDPVVELPFAASTVALHSDGQSEEDDLSMVHGAIRSFRRALGENPVGFNDEITAALVGRNVKRVAVLPAQHPAISERGELLDRWGTPYRFHALSGKLMEIQSAGPDERFFTKDDLSLTE